MTSKASMLKFLFRFLPLVGALAIAQAAPHIFFSDLESGPNSGGQNEKGAFVTIYGHGFGNERGSSTVTVGGGPVDNYPVWTDTKVTLQLGPVARSGEIVAH